MDTEHSDNTSIIEGVGNNRVVEVATQVTPVHTLHV